MAGDLVPTQPLRDWYTAYYSAGPRELARAMGRLDKRGRADSQRVRRALGIAAGMPGGQLYYRERTSYDTAARIARAMGADPADVGL